MLFPFKLVCSGTKWKRIRYHGNIPSWRRFQGLSQDVLKTSCKTKNCYAEDVFKTSWRHVLKTSWRYVLKTSGKHALKMSRRHVLKTSWRHYRDKQNTYWGCLCLTNLNVYLTNLYLTNPHLTILRRIQNALRRTHHFNICLILELKQHLYSRIKISDVWCCEISWIKIRHCKKGEAIKTHF